MDFIIHVNRDKILTLLTSNLSNPLYGFQYVDSSPPLP